MAAERRVYMSILNGSDKERPILLEQGCEYFSGKDELIMKNVGVGTTFPLHTHSYYEFFLVTSGRALHLVNNGTQIVSCGSLVMVRPSDEHSYDYYHEDDFEFWNAGFTVEQYRRVIQLFKIDEAYFDAPAMPLHVHLDVKTTQSVNQQLLQLSDTPNGQTREHMFMMILANIVYQMLTGEDAALYTELPSWLLNLIQEMEKPTNFVSGLPRLLELANYSQAHVNRVFRQYLNTTPTHYINDLRLRYAHRLLTTTDMPILDISNACGFNNASYFYTVFKNRYDACPNDLRVTARKKKR